MLQIHHSPVSFKQRTKALRRPFSYVDRLDGLIAVRPLLKGY